MKTLQSNTLLYTALISGLAFGLLLIFMPHGSGTTNTLNDLAVVLTSQLISIAAVSLVSGWILRGKVANSYIVSLFAVLYLFAFSRLVVFARVFDDIFYILLLAALSLALFHLSNMLFNKQSAGKTKKSIGASIVFIAFFVMCASLGLFLARVISSLVMS